MDLKSIGIFPHRFEPCSQRKVENVLHLFCPSFSGHKAKTRGFRLGHQKAEIEQRLNNDYPFAAPLPPPVYAVTGTYRPLKSLGCTKIDPDWWCAGKSARASQQQPETRTSAPVPEVSRLQQGRPPLCTPRPQQDQVRPRSTCHWDQTQSSKVLTTVKFKPDRHTEILRYYRAS